MGSTFSGISSALTALQVQRKAMEVAGQNVANSGTTGYTRQRVDSQALVATGSTMVSGTPRDVGDGVEITSITRVGNSFLDANVRAQTASSAELSSTATTLSSLEGLAQEPTDDGLAASLDDMWSSWHDLANNPDNDASRQVVLDKTATVIDALATAHHSVETMWDTEHAQDVARVADVNATATSVADLNRKISLATAAGGDVNDLADQRDQLVLHLSQVSGATASQNRDGSYDVYLGNATLVAGDQASTLQLTGATRLADATTSPVGLQVVTAGRAAAVTAAGGQLAAGLQALNSTLPNASASYDEVASALATSVNSVHSAGVAADGTTTGVALFTTNDGSAVFTAANLALGVSTPAGLAAATAGQGTTDGSNADAISQLQNSPGGPNALWKRYVADLGTRSASAATRSTTATAALLSATSDQQSTSGVSIDEETANLLVLQRAYQGAARVMTAVDEALDTLINKTGLVGR